jgi:hypothetical protein
MAQFLDNTIYTNHALNKICRNLIGNYEDFNFLKIKIGSGDNTLDVEKTDISSPLYTLDINEVTYKDGVITIICQIPPELADVPITEIGLFDTVLGNDYLFSYSKVGIIKPENLDYELTIVLNLGPRTIDFPGINEYYIPIQKYAVKGALNGLADTWKYVSGRLEHMIKSNAEKLNKNIAQKGYVKQLALNEILKDSTYTNLYYSLFGRYA